MAKRSAHRVSNISRDDPTGLLHAGLDVLRLGLTVFDRNLKLVFCNKAFGELRGYPSALCRPGTDIAELYHFNAERGEYGPGEVEQQVQERLALATKFEPHHFERSRPNGTVIEIKGTPLPNKSGFVATYTDITERRWTEEALRESEERYTLAMQATEEVLYEWNLDIDEIYYSPRVRFFLGLPIKALETRKDWLEGIHPGDRPAPRVSGDGPGSTPLR
jgi:PAS domain-containing protein